MTTQKIRIPDFLATVAIFAITAFLLGMLISACSVPEVQELHLDESGSMVLTSTTTTTQVVKGLVLEWEKDHPEKVAWSQAIRSQIQHQLSDFEEASDWAIYCPKYASLSDNQKIDLIATLAVGIAFYESGYHSDSVFHEPPPLSVDSIGLFQLSYEDHMKWCTMDKSKGNLKDPVVNIQCAIPMMAHLISQDGIVTSGQKPWKGMGRYWSTIRPPKLTNIQAKTKALPFCN